MLLLVQAVQQDLTVLQVLPVLLVLPDHQALLVPLVTQEHQVHHLLLAPPALVGQQVQTEQQVLLDHLTFQVLLVLLDQLVLLEQQVLQVHLMFPAHPDHQVQQVQMVLQALQDHLMFLVLLALVDQQDQTAQEALQVHLILQEHLVQAVHLEVQVHQE